MCTTMIHRFKSVDNPLVGHSMIGLPLASFQEKKSSNTIKYIPPPTGHSVFDTAGIWIVSAVYRLQMSLQWLKKSEKYNQQ